LPLIVGCRIVNGCSFRIDCEVVIGAGQPKTNEGIPRIALAEKNLATSFAIQQDTMQLPAGTFSAAGQLPSPFKPAVREVPQAGCL
jgi:hypothetical protein